MCSCANNVCTECAFFSISQFVLVDGHWKQIKSQINEWYWKKITFLTHSIWLSVYIFEYVSVVNVFTKNTKYLLLLILMGSHSLRRNDSKRRVYRFLARRRRSRSHCFTVFSSPFCTAWSIEMTQWAGPLPPVSEKKTTHRRKAIIPLLFIRCLHCHILRLCYDPDRVNVSIVVRCGFSYSQPHSGLLIGWHEIRPNLNHNSINIFIRYTFQLRKLCIRFRLCVWLGDGFKVSSLHSNAPNKLSIDWFRSHLWWVNSHRVRRRKYMWRHTIMTMLHNSISFESISNKRQHFVLWSAISRFFFY